MVALFTAGAIMTLLTLSILYPGLPTLHNFRGKNIPTAAGATLLPIILTSIVISGGEVYEIYLLLCAAGGFIDDVWGGDDRGFGGHLRALLEGRITTGLIKVGLLGVGALVVGVWEYGLGWVGVGGAVLLAACVNVANLFDVRPGRAIKFVGPAVAGLMAFGDGRIGITGVIGGLIGLFYFDLRERIMLGDTGAAVVGGVLGALIVSGGPGGVWVVAAVVVGGLTVVSEVSSISRLIARSGVLRAYDMWGRDRFE